MPFFDTDKQRAALLVLLLAVAIVYTLGPYATGLIGAPVLYVLFAPLHHKLAKWIRARPAAIVVLLLAFLILVLPGIWLIGLLVGNCPTASVETVVRSSVVLIRRFEEDSAAAFLELP